MNTIAKLVARFASSVEAKASARIKVEPVAVVNLPKERFASTPDTAALFVWVSKYQGSNKVLSSIRNQVKANKGMTAAQISFVRSQKNVSDHVVRAPKVVVAAPAKRAPRVRKAAAK